MSKCKGFANLIIPSANGCVFLKMTLHLAISTLRLCKDEFGLATNNVSPVRFWMRSLPGEGPSRNHCSSCALKLVELPMESAGPSTRSVPAVSLVLLPTTGCRLLHRRVSRRFPRKKIRLRCCSGGRNAWVRSRNGSGRFESIIKGPTHATSAKLWNQVSVAPHTQTPLRSATSQVPAFHLTAPLRVCRWSR